MADELQVDTGKLRSAAEISGGIGDRIGTILTQLKTRVDGQGEPWGNDSFGKKFADGENGYVSAHDNLVKSVDGMSGTFGDIETGQNEAADELDSGEFDNSGSFQA